jgi:hypothetical protein
VSTWSLDHFIYGPYRPPYNRNCTVMHSDGRLIREHAYVPRYLCSPVPIFPGTYIPRYLGCNTSYLSDRRQVTSYQMYTWGKIDWSILITSRLGDISIRIPCSQAWLDHLALLSGDGHFVRIGPWRVNEQRWSIAVASENRFQIKNRPNSLSRGLQALLSGDWDFVRIGPWGVNQ